MRYAQWGDGPCSGSPDETDCETGEEATSGPLLHERGRRMWLGSVFPLRACGSENGEDLPCLSGKRWA